MKISDKKHEYFEVEITFNEAEIQAIIGSIEQNAYYANRQMNEIGGLRGLIYEQLKSLVTKEKS